MNWQSNNDPGDQTVNLNADTARHAVPSPYATTFIPADNAARVTFAPGTSLEDKARFFERWAAHSSQEVVEAPPVTPEVFTIDPRPPWNGFDTFLRRALMIGGVIVVWTMITMGLLLAVGSGYALSRLGETSTVEQPLINTEEPILPTEPVWPVEPGCDPDVEVC